MVVGEGGFTALCSNLISNYPFKETADWVSIGPSLFLNPAATLLLLRLGRYSLLIKIE